MQEIATEDLMTVLIPLLAGNIYNGDSQLYGGADGVLIPLLAGNIYNTPSSS